MGPAATHQRRRGPGFVRTVRGFCWRISQGKVPETSLGVYRVTWAIYVPGGGLLQSGDFETGKAGTPHLLVGKPSRLALQGNPWAAASKGIQDSAQGFNFEFYADFVGWNQ